VLITEILAEMKTDEEEPAEGELRKENAPVKIYSELNSTITLRKAEIGSCTEVVVSSSDDYLSVHPSHIFTSGRDEVDLVLYSSVPYIYELSIRCANTTNTLHTVSIVVQKSASEQALSQSFGIGLNVFIAAAMFIMGTELDLDIIRSYLKKPLGPVIGICCQFLGMPLVAYGLGYIFLRERPFARLGFLILGSSPGGSASNMWTILFKGDMNLSVTMTFCSSIVSFGMTSFWAYVLGSTIVTDGTVSVPYVQLIGSLLSLVVPLCLGMLLTRKKEDIAARLRKFSRPVFLLVVLVSIVCGAYLQRKTFLLLSWREMLPAFLLGLSGYTIGCTVAMLN